MGRKEFEGPATFLRKLKNTGEGEQIWKWRMNHGRAHSGLGEFAPCSINMKGVSDNHSSIYVRTFLVLCCIYYFGIWCHDPMLWIGAAWSQPYVDSISCLIPTLCGLDFMLNLKFMLSRFDVLSLVVVPIFMVDPSTELSWSHGWTDYLFMWIRNSLSLWYWVDTATASFCFKMLASFYLC